MTADDPGVPQQGQPAGSREDDPASGGDADPERAGERADPEPAGERAGSARAASQDPVQANSFAEDVGEAEIVEDDTDPSALRIEELILGSARQYTPFQAARAAGVSMELASRFWRAMGFADVGQARALTEADVLALRRLSGLVEAGLLSEPMAVQVARSTGQTTARLADWQIDSFLMGLTEPPEPGMTRNEVTFPLVQLLLPELEEFLVYVWRRQLAAATGRVVQVKDDDEMVNRRQAIGFADLVGFTRLTRRLEDEELGELVEAFETTAADLVAAHGGRLIKALGDEVLYVAEDAGTAAEIGVRLIETMANDETMPELRVGIAFGTMTTRMGDVFGNTVNLASRLTSIAPKDTVLVDGAFRAELTASGAAPESEKESEDLSGFRFALQPLYQRPVRGLGVVEPWLLRRRTPPGP
ncbi:adenylate/guanylate cyclase domain-containing protein [Streptomyces diacarni]|uniref:Adenylate/guanylate cyclase domain-containing protein n=1 Tax=Streptomyces diacarni TaxID=2800381 RepID=A0A367ERD3_9ACTN|nr:adenylate/guanylate cyclase domain-containing protein [Streptomyces diacarni]RCG20533.1 adenylate/guanylate cyclase domain-containing protein [Streptomyces diacarni]